MSPALLASAGLTCLGLWVVRPAGVLLLGRRCHGRIDRRRNLSGATGAGARTHGRRRTLRDCRRSATTRATRAAVAGRMHEHGVVLVVTVMETAAMTGMLAEPEAGEEDDRDDEDDPGDDGNPRRELEDPGGPVYHLDWRRRRRCCCSCSLHCWGFRCFTHETHDARVNRSQRYALLKYQL